EEIGGHCVHWLLPRSLGWSPRVATWTVAKQGATGRERPGPRSFPTPVSAGSGSKGLSQPAARRYPRFGADCGTKWTALLREGRSRGKGGAPALLDCSLTRRSGAPPFPLRCT